jgi:hypothetical protein
MMALPTSDRPAPAPSAATVKRKKGTGGTPTQIFDDAINPAAQYHARWDTPMPISSGDERRLPPLPEPAPAPMPPTAASRYQARWDAPMPISSAEERRQPTLLEAILRLSAETDNPRRVRGEERRGRANMPTTYADDQRKGPNSPAADDRRSEIERDLVGRYPDDRRQRANGVPTTNADDRRKGPNTPSGEDRRGSNARKPRGTRSADERREASAPPTTYADDQRKGPNTLEGLDARTAQDILSQLVTAASADSMDRPPVYRFGDERRFPPRSPNSYADDLRGANARAPRGTYSADDRRKGANTPAGDDRRGGLRSRVFADEQREPGMLPGPAPGLAREALGPDVPKGKGVKLENIPAPPSKRSGKRGGEGDTAKRSSRVQRTPYDPATLKKAKAVLATAQALEAGDPGLMPNIDWDWVSEGGVSAPTPSLEEGSRWPDWMTPDIGFGGLNSLPAIDISRGNMENFIPGIDIGWNTAGESENAKNQPISVEEAQKLVALAERAQRAHAIGADVIDAKPIPIHKQVDRMTWDEYNALSPRERAAVDSNAQIVNAVRTDRANKDKYGAPTAQYNETVEQMFGPGHGSETFAPAVVSYLDSIGFHDEAADLDDFLNLNAAIREQDLKHLDPTRGPVDTSKMSDVRLDRLGLATELSERTLASVDEVMRHGEQLRATFAASAKADRGDLTVNLGGIAPKTRNMVGFGEHGAPVDQGGEGVTLDGYFQDLFTRLADKSQGPKRVQGDLAAIMANPDFNFTQEQANQFWEYVEARTAEALRYEQSLGVAGENIFSPEELRSVLNMERINSGGQA